MQHERAIGDVGPCRSPSHIARKVRAALCLGIILCVMFGGQRSVLRGQRKGIASVQIIRILKFLYASGYEP